MGATPGRPQPETRTDELLAFISDQLGQVLDRLSERPEPEPTSRPASPRPGRKGAKVTGD